MSRRIPCIVPYCRRTAPAEKYEGCEVICTTHWRMVSRETRAFKARVERRHKKLFRLWQKAHGAGRDVLAQRLARVLDLSLAACGRAWRACKHEAIEAAAGIA